MEKKIGPWTIKKTTQHYKDDFIELLVNDVIRPDGTEGKYSTVKVKPGVAILALDSGLNAYLIRQFRFAVGRQSLEVICGSVEESEPPQGAAERELQEEAGLTAREWKHLGIIDLDTSIIINPVDLFLARDVNFKEKKPEGSEDIKTVKYSFWHVVDMVASGEITHAVSCALILKANEFFRSSTPKIK